MSKTLVIIRHAKSAWDYESVSDIDRPLKETGIIRTLEVAQELTNQHIAPDLIVSSPAIRALHTALITARAFNYPPEKITIQSILYTESEDDIFEFIKQTDNDIHCLFIFGHNPVSTSLANNFLKQKIENLPTSGVAAFRFTISKWNDISKKAVGSEFSFFPKKIN